jgi:ribonuclease P protein component
VASNELSEEFLVAFAIGRAVGNAVERNTIRRRLRSLMDEIQPHCGQGLYLIKCGFATKELTYDQLREQLRSALRSAGCYQ